MINILLAIATFLPRHKIAARKVLIFFAALFSTISVEAKVWSADDIPMVHLQDRMRYVCDPDGIMSSSDRDSADTYLRRLQTECGVQTVFIVVNNVKNGDCFRMAQDVGNKYGVGDKKNRRGLVIVIAVGDRKYFIAPGKGLEGELTDVECDDIARACIVSNMKVNDTDAAVLSTVKALYKKFKTGSTGLGYDDASDELTDSESFFIIIIVFVICFGYPIYLFVRQILEDRGLVKPRKKGKRRRRNSNDDWFPPFIFGGGGGFSSGGGSFSSGGSFGGGSFGGGGAGGGW